MDPTTLIRAEVREYVTPMFEEVLSRIDATNGKLDDLRTDLTGKIEDVRGELTGRIENVRTELTDRIEDVR
ncbi:MAG: hypothetical protein DIU60_020370, partial [Actinomycetes bacterium]